MKRKLEKRGQKERRIVVIATNEIKRVELSLVNFFIHFGNEQKSLLTVMIDFYKINQFMCFLLLLAASNKF